MSRRISVLFIIIGVLMILVPMVVVRSIQQTAKGPVRIRHKWVLPIPIRRETLDPQRIVNSHEKSLSHMVFNRLVKVDEDLQVEADLLDSWTFDPASRTYHLKLKPDIRFHDDMPLTVDDVIFSFHRWAAKDSLDNDLLLPIKGVREYISGKNTKIIGINKTGESSFSLELSDWTDTLIRNLSVPRFCVYPDNFRGMQRKEFFERPVGTGPYRLLSIDPAKAVYRRNDHYYLGQPLTPEIEVRYVEESDAVPMFKTGQIDNLIMYDIVPSSGPLGAKDVVVKTMPSSVVSVLIFNLADGAFRNRALRKAVAGLIHKQQIIDSCFPHSTAASNIIPPGILGSQLQDPTLSSEPIEKKEHPFPDTQNQVPKTEMYLETGTNAACLGRTFSQIFKSTAIRPVVADLNEMYELLKRGKLRMWCEFFQFKNDDPGSVLQYFSKSSNEYLLGTTVSPLLRLFDNVKQAFTEFDRVKMYREIDRYLVKEYYVVPLFYLNSVAVYRNYVHGIETLRKLTGNWHLVYAEESLGE